MILGVDFSTRAIHGALIPLETGNGEPHAVFRTIPILPDQDPLDKYFQARLAMRELCRDEGDHPVHLVVIEQPMGRFAVRPLWGMFGALCSSCYGVVEAVTSLTPQAWRRQLGLPTNLAKEEAIRVAEEYRGLSGLNEHEAEALLVALAGRSINDHYWSEA